MSRVIEAVVSPRGESTVRTKGYGGGDCLRASKFLEQSPGGAAGSGRHPPGLAPCR